MQDYLVHIAFGLAVLYFGWGFYKNRSKKSGCEGCESCPTTTDKKTTSAK